ncbi:MAG: MFS transporter [Brockia lithotrophica]|nr:MFS transporter [Brockia lithotrophica]
MSPSPPRDPNSPANGAPREEGARTSESPSASGTERDRLRSAAWRIVLLFGIVSLFADVTYEGLRSVVGQYLALLGASAAVVGTLAGLGELLGYLLRLVGGYLADRTRYHWLLTAVGYAINLFSVPALGLVHSWPPAAALVLAERAGKGLRTPPRDALLSYATKQVGRGKGFGIHEAMDQIGALTGPLFAALLLGLGFGYRTTLFAYALPATLALLALFLVWRFFPRPDLLEPGAGEPSAEKEGSPREPRSQILPPHETSAQDGTAPPRAFSREFWGFLLFAALAAAGFLHFQLIGFHFARGGLAPEITPLLYALAMGVDAVFALVAGLLYDRIGILVLGIVPFLTVGAAAALFLPSEAGLGVSLLGMVLWGGAMGLHESVLRAAVADLTPPERRGFGYGVFNTVYGLALFASGILFGILYGLGGTYVVLGVAVLEVLALGVLAVVFLR